MRNIENQAYDSVDHLFRHHAGQMVSVLSRIFGVDKIDLIEDAVQDALLTALKKWPFDGVPGNARAWLIEVAKNRVFDRLLRDSKTDSIEDGTNGFVAETEDDKNLQFTGEIDDDQLKMIFACCHPAISPDSQVALTLKIVGGFSVTEIARAYFAKADAVAKMLTRAKTRFRSGGVPLEMPAATELNQRLDAVMRVLYLMFNEGYAASAGDELIRKDLCFEAIRLSRIISNHPVTSLPKVHALASLFLFQAARLSARSDDSGELLLLAEQDRSLWDREMLTAGLEHFRHSACGAELTDYHLEAEIASLHALSPDYESTDWTGILRCYYKLQARKFSPVVELNRIVVIGKIHGTEKALAELTGLAGNFLMTSFNLFHITRAHFLAEFGRQDEARIAYQTAERLTKNESVLRFIRKNIINLK